jgi:hypothetical protein
MDRYDSLRLVIASLEKEVEKVAELTKTTLEDDRSLGGALAVYNALRVLYDRLDDARSALSKVVTDLSTRVLPERFEAEGCSTFTSRELGARFTVTQKNNVSMVDKGEALEWLAGNGYGSLIQQTVNAQTLAKFAGEYLAETGQDLPPDLFKTSTFFYVTRTPI